MLIRVSNDVPSQVESVSGPVQNAVNSNQASLRTEGPLEELQFNESSMSLSVDPMVVKALSPPRTAMAVPHSSLGIEDGSSSSILKSSTYTTKSRF